MITNLLESKLTFSSNSTNSWGRCREELVQTGERGKVSSITYSLLPWSPKIVNEKMTTKTTDAFLNWEKVKVSNSLMQKSKACLVSGALWANPSNLLFSNHLLYHLPQTHILQHNAYISASQAFLITEFRSQVIKQRVKKPFCPRMLELSSVISHTVLIAKKVL